MTASPRPWTAYLRFGLLVSSTAVGLMLIGFLPTRSIGGSSAVAAMVAGCSISALASILGGIPVIVMGTDAATRIHAFLASMIVRLALVVGLGFVAVSSGVFDMAALMLWIAISYMALLVTDTRFALRTAESS